MPGASTSVLSSIEGRLPYPPCNSHFDDTAVIPYPSNRQVILPNGLKLEEYNNKLIYPEREDNSQLLEEFSGKFIWPYPENRGCLYAKRDRVTATQINLENSIRISVRRIGETREKVEVIQNENVVFNTEIRPYIYSGLLEAWSYDDHWCMEIISIDADEVIDDWYNVAKVDVYKEHERIRSHFDIICDGQSLKSENEYEEVFSFQVLDKKPFYFYKKGGVFGINYDGVEAQLKYDTLTWFKPHPGYDIHIYQFENMVIFKARRDDVWYEVIISVVDN